VIYNIYRTFVATSASVDVWLCDWYLIIRISF
jgi:hypothetical protein